jgi:putative toxin-antitoxin system antitoxin component (TIGR02293 family)
MMQLKEIEEALGWSHSTHEQGEAPAFALMEAAEQGVTRKMLDSLAARLQRTPASMEAWLPISASSIRRHKPEDVFNPEVSESVLHIAEVVTRGIDVFGSEEKFNLWLREPIRALGSRTPESLLKSRFGIEMVLTVLGRIEHGVYS